MKVLATKDPRLPFGLTKATVQLLERSGYVRKHPGRKRHYTFEELMLLRTVSVLYASGVPTRRINRALRQLGPWLDAALPGWNPAGPGVRLTLDAAGDGVRIREGNSFWEPDSGQYALPLERRDFEANVVPIFSVEKVMKKKLNTAHAHYLKGRELEEADAASARAAYESCLAGDCSHLEARINLGRLLHLQGLLREAEEIYNGHDAPSALLYFNLGVLLEDLKRELDAVEAYRQAIVHDPGMADAHFNLSLLHERLGEAQAAFRHLLAYRRLSEAHRSRDRSTTA